MLNTDLTTITSAAEASVQRPAKRRKEWASRGKEEEDGGILLTSRVFFSVSEIDHRSQTHIVLPLWLNDCSEGKGCCRLPKFFTPSPKQREDRRYWRTGKSLTIKPQIAISRLFFPLLATKFDASNAFPLFKPSHMPLSQRLVVAGCGSG